MITHTLQILQSTYPGSVFLSLKQSALALSINTQSLRNEINQKKINLKTVKRGRRRLVHISDLSTYIDEVSLNATVHKKRGRPRKMVNYGDSV